MANGKCRMTSNWLATLLLPTAALLLTIGCTGVLVLASHERTESPPPELSGIWAMMQVTSDRVVYPFVGLRTRTTRLVLRLEIQQEGTTLIIRETHCLADMDDGTALVQTEITEAFLRSLSQQGRRAELEPRDTGWHLTFPWGTEVHGAILEDPAHDPLPASPDDPRVMDQDGDGHPGVTVRIRVLGIISGEVYAVQRLSKHLEGPVVSEDRFEGLIAWSNEQTVLGASSTFLKDDTQAEVDPDPKKSFYIALRITDDVTCRDLKDTWRVLFGL